MTKKMYIPIYLFLVLALVSLSCSIGSVNISPRTIRGSGKVTIQSPSVSGFDAINLKAFGDVTIALGDKEGVTIEAEDNIIPLFDVAVRNGTLEISTKPEYNNGSIQATKPVLFKVSMRSLKSIALDGSGNISVSGIVTDNLDVGLKGSGNIQLDNLKTKQANFDLPGSGNMTASGETDSLTARLQGSGNIQAENLKASQVDAQVPGSGNIKVWATTSLKARVQGSGTIDYWGEPASVDKNVAGSGTINSRGSK